MTRGEIWWADLGIPFGSEPACKRPVLVIQADSFNRSRIGTVLCIPFTTDLRLADAPGNVFVDSGDTGLGKDSVLVVSQLGGIDRERLVEKAGQVSRECLLDVEHGVLSVLGIDHTAG